MDYGTTYHFGYNTFIIGAQATDVISAIGGILKMDATPERCKRGTKRQTSSRTDGHVANGFLKARFLPKLQETETIQRGTESKKTEGDFYQSLCQLSKHYGVQPMHTSSFPYPYNIALAIWDIKKKLKKMVVDFDEVELVMENNRTFFVAEQRYHTGQTLFYIPVAPIYRMMKDRRRKRTAQLLLSVCSYLYNCADIPYYRHGGSYLYSNYDMLQEWVLSDDDGEGRTSLLRELAQAECIGDLMQRKLCNLANLEQFDQRLKQFRSVDDLDDECLKLARQVFALYLQYPKEPMSRYSVLNTMEEDEEDAEYPISMDMYVSFCAEAKGDLFDNLFDTVNTYLQEFSTISEPTINQYFDGSEVLDRNLDFEDRLFSLIDELVYVLNKF